MDTPVIAQRSAVPSADGTPIGYQTLGAGDGVIVIGGSLATSEDYLRLASGLGPSFAAHVVDRRGRGASGPQGPGYSIENECEDLIAVQAATGAAAVFGHSYGGLVALETARRVPVFSHVAVYEPGVSIGGSIPAGWIPRFRELLAAGDTRGAFACMVRGAGYAPAPLASMPPWAVRAVLRLAIRQHQWRKMEPLLQAHLAEHEELARLDDGTADRYRAISARVLLLGGQNSPAFATSDLFGRLRRAIADADAEILDGLDHTAPQTAPEAVAERVRRFLPSTARGVI